jgi:hypothetical protein
MTDTITFEQIKPTIIASFRLQDAKECQSGYSSEYYWNNHPDYPKNYLLWADVQDGKYILYDLKVQDPAQYEPRDKLYYAIGRTGISKTYFGTHYGSIDSENFGIFKLSNKLEETPFFRTRMLQLLSDKK